MPGETALARSGAVVPLVPAEFKDCISLAQGQPQIPFDVEVNGPWSVQRRSLTVRFIWCGAGLARAGERRDDTCSKIDTAHSMIPYVTDVKMSVRPELNAVGLPHPCGRGGALVATKAGLAVAGHGGDRSGAMIYPAHHVIAHLDKKEVPIRIESHFVRFPQLSRPGRSIVPVVTGLPRASHRFNDAVGVDPAQDVIAGIADVKCSVRAARQTERIIQLRLAGGTSIAAVTGLASPGNCLNGKLVAFGQTAGRANEGQREDLDVKGVAQLSAWR